MVKDDMITVFDQYITGDILDIGNNQTIPVDDFCNLFANAELTYDSLMGNGAEEKGYKNFFDRCVAEGILT